jgi:acyl-CoA synthetase (NDP forming)
MLTVSGGAGVLMADVAAASGLEAPPMPESAQAQILARIAFASARNPVDVTGQVGSDPELTPLAYRLMLEDADYDSLVVFLSAGGLSAGGRASVQLASEMRARHPDRVIALSSLFPPELHRKLDEAGVLAFADPSRAVRAVAALAQIAADAPASDENGPSGAKIDLPAGSCSEVEAMAYLEQAGLPMVPHRLCDGSASAAAAAEVFGFPVVAKIVSPDILHKTDAGGVALNLHTPADVAKAARTLMTQVRSAHPGARLDGILVAPMVAGGVECILGVQRDPVFGPMVMFGLGGVLVEAFRDVSFRLAPFGLAEAHRMIDEIKARPLLDEFRGRPAADIPALADALVALSRFAAAAGERLVSAELNPFVVHGAGRGAVALDAVLITEPATPA